MKPCQTQLNNKHPSERGKGGKNGGPSSNQKIAWLIGGWVGN